MLFEDMVSFHHMSRSVVVGFDVLYHVIISLSVMLVFRFNTIEIFYIVVRMVKKHEYFTHARGNLSLP